MISIKKIRLYELEEFVSSDFFKDLKIKPISIIRASSYLENPRANKNDIVLYMAFLENELVAYRTILSDIFFIDDKPISFGWLSGNWVALKHRRKGFSTLLFREVLKDWKGKLMYTNYAEASKLLYDKTEQFSLLHRVEGVKYYTRFCLADILPKKKKIFKKTKILWIFLDRFLNLFTDLRSIFKYSLKENSFYLKTNEPWNDTLLELANNFTNKNLFQRSKKEFNWIQKHPWILSGKKNKEDAKSYHFSSYAKEFNSNAYTIYNTKNCLIGYFLLTVRDGHMKIPYAFFDEENSEEITNFIINKCNKEKVKTIVVYNKKIEVELNNRLSFITKKEFIQKYFMTKELKKFIKTEQEIVFQTGDGDVVFT